MSKIYNLYCDESCHLQYDGNDIMVIGTVYCEKKYSYEINADIRKIKEKYGISLFMQILESLFLGIKYKNY